jgi:hypothetical protein
VIEEVCYPGGMLQVVNPFGLTVYKNAKLAQFVFHELKEKVRMLIPSDIHFYGVCLLAYGAHRISCVITYLMPNF